jgi:hypothetical protein
MDTVNSAVLEDTTFQQTREDASLSEPMHIDPALLKVNKRGSILCPLKVA